MDTNLTLQAQKWHWFYKWLFYFGFTYIIIYLIPTSEIMPWFGNLLFADKKIDYATVNGSGDKSVDYVTELFTLILSFIVSILLLILLRNKNHHLKWRDALRIIVRYYLAYTLLSYGFAKFNNGQFAEPDLRMLDISFGHKTPMGLAWSFMGYSKVYSTFAGIFESLGGLSLLFRRTLRLGIVIALSVMVNVMMMNYCFDIPVKLFSTFLTVLLIALLLDNYQSFLQFFISQKSVAETNFSAPYFEKKWLNVIAFIFKYVMIVGYIGMTIYEVFRPLDYVQAAPIKGIYKVETWIENKDTIPLLITDSIRISKIIVEYNDQAIFKTPANKNKFVYFSIDTSKHQILTYSFADTLDKSILNYTLINDQLRLTGIWHQDSITAIYKKFNDQSFNLEKTGFNWVNEYPNNR